MSLLSFISKQFIDVIQCTEDGPGLLAWRFPMQDMEIQTGASLTVRETQRALFLNEGTVADGFGPGRYTLRTSTLPVLTYLRNWDKLFESPFKSDVVFFFTREQTDQRWGTTQPVTIRDKEFGPLRIRANGAYAYRIAEPAAFYARLSGTTPRYTAEDAAGQLRAAILTAIGAALGSSAVPFLDMAGNQLVLSAALKDAVSPVFATYGLELTQFFLNSLSLPEDVQEHLDRRSSMSILGDMGAYTRFEAAESLRDAASNPGGVAGAGAGLGAGLALGQTMGAALAGAPAAAATPAQPEADPIALIERLGELMKKGVLSQAEFDAKKAELLQRIR